MSSGKSQYDFCFSLWKMLGLEIKQWLLNKDMFQSHLQTFLNTEPKGPLLIPITTVSPDDLHSGNLPGICTSNQTKPNPQVSLKH